MMITQASSSSSPPPQQQQQHGQIHYDPIVATHKNPTLSRGLSNISEPKNHAGIFGTISNLVNSIVGAGIIGLPFALKESGMVTGTVLLILVGWLTNKSLRIIVDTACFHPKLVNVGVLTYEDLMSLPFGRFGSLFLLTSMFLTAYGAMLSYFIIIKDNVPKLIELDDQANLVMVVTTLMIILPLAMMRDVATLSFTSVLSVAADFILIVFIAFFSPIQESVSDAGGFGHVLSHSIISKNVFVGLGVISMAMACQHSAFIVSGSLENKTSSRWGTVTSQALAFSTVICVGMGLFGYLGFLDHTKGDILNNFPTIDRIQGIQHVDDFSNKEETISETGNIVVYGISATAARALLSITMFFTYPMESLVARHVLCKIFFQGDIDGEIYDDHGTMVTKETYCFGCLNRRQTLSLSLYMLTLVPALLVEDVGPVLSISGAIGTTAIAYIGPGMVYLGVNGEAFLTHVYERIAGVSNTSPATTIGTSTTRPSTIETLYRRIQESSRKPLWYWLCGFPLWCWIAYQGSMGTEQTLDKFNRDFPSAKWYHINGGTPGLVQPCIRDYYISIFLIVFGAIAGVIGLAQNIINLI